MAKIFTSFLIAFLSAFVVEGTLSAQINNDYWIVVPANYNPTWNKSVPNVNSPRLTLLAENPTNVIVKAANATDTVTADQTGWTLTNAMPMIPLHKLIVKRAIHAWSTDGLPFHVQLTIPPEEWGEGTWCIPTHSLGKMYRIVGYKASNASIHPADYDNSSVVTPEFAIVATKDNTQVTIDFPPVKNLAPIAITMNAGDAYHVDCGKPDVNIDPTGTRVTANQPIAVFSGQANADIGGTGFGNALLEQMFPIESWGKLHMIVPDPLQSGDIYRFVADCDSTKISNDGTMIATIDAGKFYEATISGAHEICSTKPIEVVKFTRGGQTLYNDQGGPSMLVIPPISCYFDSSRFYQLNVPADPISGTIGVPGVVIICPTVYTPLVLFDGAPVGGFAPILNSCSPIQYSWTYAPIAVRTAGSHTLCYSTPPAANPYSLYGYYTAEDGDRDENLEWNVGYRNRVPSLAIGNLDFGALICDTIKTMTVVAKNIGFAPLIISSVSGLTGSSFTLLGPTFPDTIKPQDSIPLIIRFTNSIPGVYAKTLFLVTNEGGICDASIDSIRITARKERAAITSAPRSYDFGDVTCQEYETTVTVTNVGTVNAQVTSKTFSQAGIEIISPPVPVTINPGNTQQFTIRLRSSLIPVGTYSSALHLTAQPCNLSCDFQFTANRKALVYNVSPAIKDFGITNINKTSSGTFTFDNQSDAAIHIGSAKFDSTTFNVTTTFGQMVAPHSSLAINFTCYPPDTLKYESTLTINIDSPCVDDRKVLVRVEGASVCPQAMPTEIIGAVPGEIATIPIIVDPSTKLSSTQKIDVRVKYDEDLLRYGGDPLPETGMSISNIQPLSDGVSFTITTNGLPAPKAEIARIKVQALLSTHADGTIDVLSSTFTLSSGEQIKGGSCPVPFLLGEACVKPSDLKPRSSAVIEGIYPNPTEAGATIAINAFGHLPHVLIDVFDTFGRKVETVADGLFTSGKHEIALDAARYSNGIYFCRMISGGIVVTKEFNVRK